MPLSVLSNLQSTIWIRKNSKAGNLGSVCPKSSNKSTLSKISLDCRVFVLSKTFPFRKLSVPLLLYHNAEYWLNTTLYMKACASHKATCCWVSFYSEHSIVPWMNFFEWMKTETKDSMNKCTKLKKK